MLMKKQWDDKANKIREGTRYNRPWHPLRQILWKSHFFSFYLNVKVEPVCSKLKLYDLIDFFPRRLAVPLFGYTQDDTCPTHTHVHTGHKQIERDVPEPSRKVAIVRNPPNYGLLRNWIMRNVVWFA